MGTLRVEDRWDGTATPGLHPFTSTATTAAVVVRPVGDFSDADVIQIEGRGIVDLGASRCASSTVIIPALDEEASIGAVLDALPGDVVGEVIVVDGGSRDGTAAAAIAHGARLVREGRRGYGRACARGAAEAHGDVLVFLDADGAADPREIPALLAPIAHGRADLVLGSRFAGSVTPEAMLWHQRFGNRLSARLIHLLYGHALTDLSPFRAVRRALLNNLPLEDLTYGWPTEMIVKAARAGWRITEVPVACRPRIGGHSKISGTVRGTALATFHILHTIARHTRYTVDPR